MSAFAKLSVDTEPEKDRGQLGGDEKSGEVVEVDESGAQSNGQRNGFSDKTVTSMGTLGKNLSYRPQRTESPRVIRISGFEERKTRLSKYHVFVIEVEPPITGVINVARRFNDFKWLRSRLCNRFGGVFVPPLGPNKILGRYESDFVKERMKDLQRFLNRIEEISAFSECVEFKMFLTRPESTMVEGKKEITDQYELYSNNIDEKCKSLIELFPDLNSFELSDNHSTEDIPRLKEFLIKVELSMKQLEQCANKLFTNFANVANEMDAFSDSFKLLYNAESNYPYKPNIERLDLRSEFDAWKSFQDTQTNNFYHLFLNTLRHEHEDIVAFLEVFKYRDTIENQLSKIKQRVEKWTNFENNLNEMNGQNAQLTPKQLEQKSKDNKDEEEYTQLLVIVTKIILFSEMPKVWMFKTSEWKRQLLEFAQQAATQNSKMTQAWSNVQQS